MPEAFGGAAFTEGPGAQLVTNSDVTAASNRVFLGYRRPRLVSTVDANPSPPRSGQPTSNAKLCRLSNGNARNRDETLSRSELNPCYERRNNGLYKDSTY
jgi:hypothetical protein